MQDLGCTTNIDVMNRMLALDGKTVLDIGCGGFAFSKMLAECGASVIGIDPDPIQAEKNRANPVAGIEFLEAGADHIPCEDSSLDGVTFAYSLHHVPSDIYPQMFEDIFRVLKPGGFLYVIEPTKCDGDEVMRLFHNEDEVREKAWAALTEIAKPRFESCTTATYYSVRQYDSWEDYATTYASKSFNSLYTEADVRHERVRAAYERLAGPNNRLDARKNVMALLDFRG